MKVILIVTLLAVLLSADLSDSAAMRSEEFAEQVRRMAHDVYPDSLRTQRATKNAEDRPKRNCYDTPCGWNAYNPATRRPTTFMANTCKCPDESYKCVRTGEIVSMKSYVYHCRQNTTADDIESTDDAESPEYGS